MPQFVPADETLEQEGVGWTQTPLLHRTSQRKLVAQLSQGTDDDAAAEEMTEDAAADAAEAAEVLEAEERLVRHS